MAPKPKDERDPSETCSASKKDGDPCMAYPLEGRDKCRVHAGTKSNGDTDDHGAPEGNLNSVTHGMHVDEHAWYSKVATDSEREIVDNVFASYLERYRTRQGEPDAGDEWELFFCAVTIGKEIHGEKWAVDKPRSLKSGNSLVDQETKYTQDGREYHEYKTTVVQKAANSLSKRRRMWLKDLGLLESPEQQQADATQNLAAVIEQNQG